MSGAVSPPTDSGARQSGLAGRLQGLRMGVRYKLLVLTLAPSLLVIPPVLAFTVYWSHEFAYAQLYRKVNADLEVAREGFRLLQAERLSTLELLAQSYAFRSNLRAGATAALGNQLETLRTTSGFDFLHLIDPQGRRLVEVSRTGGERSPDSPQLERAVSSGFPSVGLEVFGPDELRREAPELASRAQVPLHAAPGARPGARQNESRGLVLRTLYPLMDESGRVAALLDGGVLLNRNYTFVDAIRALVYGPGSVPPEGWGAVTLLLGDTRISTNVRLEEGERALGTQVAAKVRERVLEQGQTLVTRAWVVNQWYISAYQPLYDAGGERVGILHTGFTEAPFQTEFARAVALLVGALLLGLAAGAWLAFRGARAIFQPIEMMSAVVQAEQSGGRRRIGPVRARDEIGDLARQLDSMLDQLEQRRRIILANTEQLESRVAERTAQVEAHNRQLQTTVGLLREARQRMGAAEKFAALGELTAGVAHEINNPVAVILGNLDVIIAELGKEGSAPVRTELDLIVQQIYRIRSIVDKLLRYARPAEYVEALDPVDVNELLEDTLVLVRHELARKAITAECRLQASGAVQINRQELQQVVVNLIINAIRALPQGGRLELSTEDLDAHRVRIRVKDYGEGIPRANLDRVFDPFFTTRREKGTGLGLSVSYSLVTRYGGEVSVDSEPGQWTRFDVALRREPAPKREEGCPPDPLPDGPLQGERA